MVDDFYAWDKENRVHFKKRIKRLKQQWGKNELKLSEVGVFYREREEYLAKKNAYNTVIDLAIKKEYAVSTNGVVKALHFNAKEDKFLSKG